MSKKKKEKAVAPKKTKAKSSKSASRDVTPRNKESKPAPELQSPAAPKPVRETTPAEIPDVIGLSADDIALRAYYLAEHRRNLNLPGDDVDDWIEAERQLRKELDKKSS
ncbi:MAG TPA: DUF2934 domain-containing protein [Terrimicrobiaceae bacterium]